MQLYERYDPIKETLASRDKKMNAIIVPLCICFAAMSIVYVVRFFAGGFYTPEDGILYYQIFVEAGGGALLIACAVTTVLLGSRHPMLPRYLFAAAYLLKAVFTTMYIEFGYFIFYVIPVMFAIGYYDLRFSIRTSAATLAAYIGAELAATRYGMPLISFYNVEYSDGLLFRFSDVGYAYNRIVAQTVPTALMLLFLCLLSVFLSKSGADSLLREHKINGEKAALDKELALGNEIQQSMLPDRVWHTPFFSAFSYMVSAKNVGGDFFDYFMIGENKVLFTIGDVSGKGISASLFASNTKALIRAYAMSGYEPCEILQETNSSLCSTNKKKLFVTVWLGILDLETGDCVYCSAGHNPPIIKRKTGETSRLSSKPNFIVGRRDNISYSQHHIILDPGDCIVMYTDGVTEAMNGEGELFGDERLLSFTEAYPVEDSFTKKPREKVFDFMGEAEQNDDISIACLSFSNYKISGKTERSFKAKREEYPHLCDFVMKFAEKHTDDRRKLNDIELSLGEVFSNIEFYSAGGSKKITDVSVGLSAENGVLSIVFTDDGIPFDPLSKPDPSLEENRKSKVIGGFGIFMVKKLMDDVSYQYNGKNILTLKKKLTEE